VIKPAWDILVFCGALRDGIGRQAPFIVVGWYIAAALILNVISPASNVLAAEERYLNDNYATSHRNIMENSEQIVMNNLSDWEDSNLSTSLYLLKQSEKTNYRRRFLLGFLDGVFLKYGSSIMSMIVLNMKQLFDLSSLVT
jgi:ATP-binding cassette subfamily D (ALD) protein 3